MENTNPEPAPEHDKDKGMRNAEGQTIVEVVRTLGWKGKKTRNTALNELTENMPDSDKPFYEEVVDTMRRDRPELFWD